MFNFFKKDNKLSNQEYMKYKLNAEAVLNSGESMVCKELIVILNSNPIWDEIIHEFDTSGAGFVECTFGRYVRATNIKYYQNVKWEKI